MAREGTIEYCANNKADVMRSLTNIMAPTDGMKASKRGSSTFANGAATAKAATSNTARARTKRRCCDVAGKFDSEMTRSSSDDSCTTNLASAGQYRDCGRMDRIRASM